MVLLGLFRAARMLPTSVDTRVGGVRTACESLRIACHRVKPEKTAGFCAKSAQGERSVRAQSVGVQPSMTTVVASSEVCTVTV